MILPLLQVPSDAHEAALWWCTRRQLRLLSPREEARFQRWLENPANAEAWEALNRPLDELCDIATLPEIRAMRDKALASTGATFASTAGEDRSRTRWWAGGALAAGLAGLLLLATPPAERVFRTDEPQAVQPVRYASALGERRGVALADGSVVTLNTASTMEVAYGGDAREVRLLSGQARFDVAPDRERPFVVLAGNRRITAVGTRFDVRVGSDGEVKVVLLQGRVRVEPVRQSGIERLLSPLSADTLRPGEQLVASQTGQVSVVTADLEKATSWQQGQLVFRDDPLAEAIAEMNRYSEAKIVALDPAIGDLRVSGVFRTDRQDNFLAALAAFYPVEAERQTAGMIALKWRGGNREAGTEKGM
ncbi:hypothetical protein GRI75_05710 [Altererythrobacter soli]|uniref:FecR protein domain-containing protein n=1 Tax=Croceibacterium soli TaxID=1739690 RepID=A0A6I4UQT5_9SPHN|nr:FecR domain-containing protein [Croceibacterium soli]MXP41141.1 hypothetical protein [Croceibacterium soli]